MFSDVNRPTCQMYVRSKLRPTPSGKQRYPQAVGRQLIVYLVVSWCLCEINLCKQNSSKTFPKLMADTPHTTWKWLLLTEITFVTSERRIAKMQCWIKSCLKQFQIKITYKMIFKIKIIQINFLVFLQCWETVSLSVITVAHSGLLSTQAASQNVLSLSLFRRDVAVSPAELNSRSTGADDVSDVLHLTKCKSFCAIKMAIAL